MSSLVGTGVGSTVVEYIPVVKLLQGTAVQKAVQDAFPYGFVKSVAEAVVFEFQLPHCVVVKFGTKLLSDAYGGA
jgi:hypothetical protein